MQRKLIARKTLSISLIPLLKPAEGVVLSLSKYVAASDGSIVTDMPQGTGLTTARLPSPFRRGAVGEVRSGPHFPAIPATDVSQMIMPLDNAIAPAQESLFLPRSLVPRYSIDSR